LHQKDVAKIIGVTTSSIWNWEHGLEPELRYQPQIITFLGYIPFDCPTDTMGRLAWYKRVHGMTLDDLGEIMKRDPEQLSDWLSGRHRPLQKNRLKIEGFLAESWQRQLEENTTSTGSFIDFYPEKDKLFRK
jgi:transcriptional regulator with XRE-family HTH domain